MRYRSICVFAALCAISEAFIAGFDVTRAPNCAASITKQESRIRVLTGPNDFSKCYTFGKDMDGVKCFESSRPVLAELGPDGGCLPGDFTPTTVVWDYFSPTGQCFFFSEEECGSGPLNDAISFTNGCLVAPEGKSIKSFRCAPGLVKGAKITEWPPQDQAPDTSNGQPSGPPPPF